MTKRMVLGFLAISLIVGSVGYAKQIDNKKEKNQITKKEGFWSRIFKSQENENQSKNKKSRIKKTKEDTTRNKEGFWSQLFKGEQADKQKKANHKQSVRSKRKAEKNKNQKKGFWSRLFKSEEEKKQDKKRKIKSQMEQLKKEEDRLAAEERAKRKMEKDKARQKRELVKKEQDRLAAQERAKRKTARQEKERMRCLAREEKTRRAEERCARYEADLRAQKKAARENRIALMSSWKDVREKEVAQDYSKGAYADLYKVPSWPFYMLYTEDENKDFFRVEAKYDYATSAYNSDGSSQDVTSLAFGEKSIQWQDLSMALRLDKKGIILSKNVLNIANNDSDAGDVRKVTWDLIKTHLADKELQFLGSTQNWGVSFNYFRYLKGKDLAFGAEVPFGYKSHRLKLDSPVNPLLANDTQVLFKNVDDFFSVVSRTRGLTSAAAYATSSNVLEHSMIPETLNYLLAPKGLSYLPKMSVTGIGDVATFLNYYVTTKYLERFVLGARVSWPTAKDAVTHKVWAPQLGNGFTKISAYASLLFNKQGKYFNPYTFLQASFNWPGHKKTRVPRIINFDGKVSGDSQAISGINYYTQVAGGTQVNAYLQNLISYGQRIDYTQARSYTEYDTQIPAFADNVKSVRVQPGPEVELRFGNMFEEFIFRRAFFDVYYNFMAKWKDYIGGNLPRDIWAVDLLKDNTYQLEHKFGGELSYQFDAKTRLHVGADWVFAGRNVAKNLEIRGNLAVAF